MAVTPKAALVSRGAKDPARFRAGSLLFVIGHGHHERVPGQEPHAELVDYLANSCPLSQAEAARVVAEVLGYFSEAPEEFVRRRHRELKARGLTNDQAFGRIAAELPQRRYGPPELSLRQMRRIVYG